MEETTARGNGWEVVSLTASAYAAAPGPKKVDMNDEEGSATGNDEAETSHAMFMSTHFVFPPSLQENLPLETQNVEVHNEPGVRDAVLEEVTTEGCKSKAKADENWKLEGLNMSEEFPEIRMCDEKESKLCISGAEFDEDIALQGLNIVNKEQSMYESATFDSLHSEATMGGSPVIEENSGISVPNEQSDQGLYCESSDLPEDKADNNYNGPELPCKAWWKRQAASLYVHAKEANAIWPMFIAAAVMGLVILGHRWQQERWTALQLKREIGSNDVRIGRTIGPLSRFRDVIVGGQRRGSSISGSTSAGH